MWIDLHAWLPRAALLAAAVLVCACGEDGGPADAAWEDEAADPAVEDLALEDEGPSCTANNDGVLDRSEILFIAGASVDYTMNPAATTVDVNLVPGTGSEGEPLWNFSEPLSERVTLTYMDAAGQWFTPEFPGATYALPASPGSSLLGIYRITDDRIALLGSASLEEGLTLLVYDNEVPILRFPLAEGDGWIMTARIEDGLFEGNPFASEDTYDVEVAALGTVDLGFLTMRNSLQVTITTRQRFPGGETRISIQHVWLHECYGEIVRVRSLDGETDPLFDRASEVRILAL
jgi:hypothetical protein